MNPSPIHPYDFWELPGCQESEVYKIPSHQTLHWFYFPNFSHLLCPCFDIAMSFVIDWSSFSSLPTGLEQWPCCIPALYAASLTSVKLYRCPRGPCYLAVFFTEWSRVSDQRLPEDTRSVLSRRERRPSSSRGTDTIQFLSVQHSQKVPECTALKFNLNHLDHSRERNNICT